MFNIDKELKKLPEKHGVYIMRLNLRLNKYEEHSMKAKIKNSRIQSDLSIERTKMANRRTLLAYIRSVVGLIVAGAGLMEFIDSAVWMAIGIGCIVLAPNILIFGLYDYFHMKKLIQMEKDFLEEETEEN